MYDSNKTYSTRAIHRNDKIKFTYSSYSANSPKSTSYRLSTPEIWWYSNLVKYVYIFSSQTYS